MYQKCSNSKSSRNSGKDIKGLKRRERIKEEKGMKLKTLRNIYVKRCNIILHLLTY